ncbi:Uncharacterised protein [Salmonella enterica subsp. enterica serovar Bovismorbificans]|uniref:Uncharacterized protein n=1 Tax=Salmonella enterica subsp. enterica serovar Bovismorbificans TaxID=58097 RepID=A0A655BQS5_SALET|nr:Uncharacterised protein [Salmonella enterica subsp. enterica serovar Bovismorbificans]CNU46672.1 Uncharacterised protein [Salmonella enterica subsp. enterica serovar Bovismorbificans]CNU67039.1 Uncharacterised protein [Salmonella enterica subsp. enterica serovar Bovismorbificans]CPR45791.1 Uncharacterised protein [Salmonella enterica subsp. enterica serovar Bovismorbificans]
MTLGIDKTNQRRVYAHERRAAKSLRDARQRQHLQRV